MRFAAQLGAMQSLVYLSGDSNMKKKLRKSEAAACPCGSGLPLSECCWRYHNGAAAPDAVSLMRSRYSAFALGLAAYLLATWHASTRPSVLDLAGDKDLKWVGLVVQSASERGDAAEVSFVARYKVGGRAGEMAEKSRFVREGGKWFYIDGKVGEE